MNLADPRGGVKGHIALAGHIGGEDAHPTRVPDKWVVWRSETMKISQQTCRERVTVVY